MKRKNRKATLQCCPPKPKLEDRSLIPHEQSLELESTFKMLANVSRLRILHALVREKEMSVLSLAKVVSMKPQAVSNQLRRMTDRGIVASRREGNHIHYRMIDPCVASLLDQGLCLAEDAKERRKKI